MEKAVSCERKYALHFAELDELYEQAGTPIEKRLPLFEKNQTVVAQRDDAQNRAVALKVASGRYGEAIQMMTGRKFAVAEGANLNIAEHWTDAHVLRAQQRIAARRYAEALADLQAAANVPDNLPSGFRAGGSRAVIAYWTGVAYDGIGDHAKATESWNGAAGNAPSAAAGRRGGGMGGGRFGGGLMAGDQPYYQALCLQKLGQADRAKTTFQSLVDSGQAALRQQPDAASGGRDGRGGMGRQQTSRQRTAAAHYSLGLVYLG